VHGRFTSSPENDQKVPRGGLSDLSETRIHIAFLGDFIRMHMVNNLYVVCRLLDYVIEDRTTMSSGNPESPGSPPEGRGFAAIDTISANDKPLGDILSCILQHEKTGIPLVVRGLHADSNWSPLPGADPPGGHGDVERRLPGRWRYSSLRVNLT